ncbi:hypothetical protein PVK64_14585, partial [Aliivibrio sp. S4TY2]|nr:hypothetical protein [Aliivibrio sp. S4TY2]MDD9161409.1 hypothetical protein [Aliivibrio sp. S4TY1]MDD9165439.1 hypothetical protein [Aliivibrio sp. S4MY2]MDD9169306.1 hypothetical protein [Aliivibrio sp. S4MY4]MDD9186299.1 hypothetical protein [Aliivibrio sp. S4MY3]MDD9203614.1 hypothetical protein [Aliivibrio sp. S4MY1]
DLKDKNLALGITTNDTVNKQENAAHANTNVTDRENQRAIQAQKIAPLTTQVVKSQAQVALTIKSEKPITVDNIAHDKGLDLSVDLGNMALSY